MVHDVCIKDHVEYSKQQQKRSWSKKKKEIKESIKTHKDYIKELQTIFNKFIRLRDSNKGCISCGNPLETGFHAGHYFAT